MNGTDEKNGNNGDGQRQCVKCQTWCWPQQLVTVHIGEVGLDHCKHCAIEELRRQINELRAEMELRGPREKPTLAEVVRGK